jgi:uncharacterized protein (TIGR02246 family)
MRSRLLWLLAVPALVAGFNPPTASAQQAGGSAEDKEAIAKNAEAFVEAFHKGDAAALAAFWAPNGDYTDLSGHRMRGRKAIARAFKKLFAEHEGLKVRIESESLRFLTPEVAIEDGTTAVIAPGGAPPSRARYTIVHVKKGGRWLLGSVRDAAYAPPGNREHLRGLEWALGDWASEPGKGPVERLSVSWAEGENFVVATFSTAVGDATVGQATQWIGWDPLAKRVRSWIFDAAGGYGEGAWSRDGNRWIIKATSVRQDGKKAAATYVLTRVDADTISLQARDRSVGGKMLPPIKPVRLKRVP